MDTPKYDEPVGATMQTVTHDGRRTAYRLTGHEQGEQTALYVHGSGGTHRVWVNQYAPTGPTHPAAAVDLSGHGHSDDVETAPGAETLSAYVADVVAVAREVDASVLVGNSLGGAVVLETLLETSFEPDAVVLAGTGAKLAVGEQLRTLLAEEFDAAVELLHRPSMLFADADDRLLERSKETTVEVGQRVTRRDFLTCHEFDVRERLAEIDVPALAIVGEDDRLTPPWYHEHLAEELATCQRAVVEDAAHLAMLEQPTAFNAAVEQFLNGLSEH